MLAVPLGADIDTSEVRLELAARLYDSQQISLGVAARIAGLSYSEMIDALGARGIATIQLEPGELGAGLPPSARSAMASIVVSDAGPLISLEPADLLACCRSCSTECKLLTAVPRRYMARPDKRADTLRIQAALDQNCWWHAMQTHRPGRARPGGARPVGRAVSGAGLLADDHTARQCALELGLDIIGALGVCWCWPTRWPPAAISPLVGNCAPAANASATLPFRRRWRLNEGAG